MSLSKYALCALYAALSLSTPLFTAEDATETLSSSLSAILEDDTSSKGAPVSDDILDDLNNTEKMPPENDRAEGDKEKDTLEGENETKSPSTILKNNPPFERHPFENSLTPFEDTPPHKN